MKFLRLTHLLPVLEKAFRRHKRPVGKSWRMNETYIRVKGEWRYLYRAVDRDGNTIDFLLRAHRDKAAARRFFEKSIAQNDVPETVTIDKSGANLAALEAINADRETPSGSASPNISTTLWSRTIGRSSDALDPCWGSRISAARASC